MLWECRGRQAVAAAMREGAAACCGNAAAGSGGSRHEGAGSMLVWECHIRQRWQHT